MLLVRLLCLLFKLLLQSKMWLRSTKENHYKNDKYWEKLNYFKSSVPIVDSREHTKWQASEYGSKISCQSSNSMRCAWELIRGELHCHYAKQWDSAIQEKPTRGRDCIQNEVMIEVFFHMEIKKMHCEKV